MKVTKTVSWFAALLVFGWLAAAFLVPKLHSSDKLPVDEVIALKIENLEKDQQIKQFQFAQLSQQAMQLQNAYREAQTQIQALQNQAFAKAHVTPEDYMLDVKERTLTRKPKPVAPPKAAPAKPPAAKKK